MLRVAFISAFLLTAQAQAEENDLQLPPIRLVGDSAAEGLHALNPTPAVEHPASQLTGSGNLDQSISQTLAIPITPATGGAGQLSQVRGLGRSAEEMNVEVFGVPLNPAQGGGFNFSIFPQFVWSSFEFRSGPVLGGSDPRAVAGGLVLRPWTAEAAENPRIASRVTAFYSGLGVAQFSTAYDSGNSALLVGWSLGDVRGPTSSGTFRLADDGDSKWTLHVLGTSLELDTPQTSEKLVSRRVIPVVQNETREGDRRVHRSSFFYDGSYNAYSSSDGANVSSLDRVNQIGAEHASFSPEWSYGAAARHIRFVALSSSPPSETQLHLRLLRKIDLGSGLSLLPALQGVAVTQLGVFPEAFIGAEKRLPERVRAFTRVGLSRRVPSLLDRFYVLPASPQVGQGYVGNPELTPERAWSLTGGVAQDLRSGTRWDLTLNGQVRENSLIFTSLPDGRGTVVNSGEATVVSLNGNWEQELSGRFGLRSALTWTTSRLGFTGREIPNLPNLLGVIGFTFQSPIRDRATQAAEWSTSAIIRGSSDVDAGFRQLPAYAFLDLQGHYHLVEGLMLGAQLTNATGRPLEIVAGVPPLERTVSVMVSGTF